MILSGQSIRKRGIFTPFHERTKSHGMTFGLGPAGYDVRVAESHRIAPRSFNLASTIEHFIMPFDVLGKVTDKSTWARCGLAVQNTIIEPGWRGFLTLELCNNSDKLLIILAGMPIAQIVFHLLDEPTETPYSGKYQDQKSGATPPMYE